MKLNVGDLFYYPFNKNYSDIIYKVIKVRKIADRYDIKVEKALGPNKFYLGKVYEDTPVLTEGEMFNTAFQAFLYESKTGHPLTKIFK
jgi:hypothetical protein